MVIPVLIVVAMVVMVVLGFLIYGMFLGLSRLAGLLAKAYRWLMTPEADLRRQTGKAPDTAPALNCWELKQCQLEAKEKCPAYKHQDLPCWLARMQYGGKNRIEADCLGCKLFSLPKLVGDV